MRAIIQMSRQLGKSLSGLVLCALAAAILVVSGGQYYAAVLTRANLDDRYDTLALASEQYLYKKDGRGTTRYSTLPEEYREWVSEVIRTRPDLVKGEMYAGGLSAYIPEMAPDNFSRHEEGFYLEGYSDGNPYRCAIFEMTLTGVGTMLYEDNNYYSYGDSDEEVKIRYSISCFCAGTIDRIIGLEQGFASPERKTIALRVTAYDEDALEALQLEEGERYLVYGMNYSDVRGIEKSNLFLFQEYFEELFGAGLSKGGFDEKVDCFMTVCDYSSLPHVGPDGDGRITVFQDKRRYYTRLPDLNGTYRAKGVPAEAYIPDYCVPTMAKLEGGAEDYLASEEGFLWRQALEEMEISNHGFPVLAVEKLGYQVSFAREQARIVEGRDFTERERSGGSKVCILSQSLAEANGLKVGDRIDLRYYGYDHNIQMHLEDELPFILTPSAAVYSRSVGFLTETEGYRIVGLYRQNNAWQNSFDRYGFTPNTIFVPKSSASCEMLVSKSGVYYSLVLQNGKKDEFERLQREAGYPDLFICMDQGYSQMVSALEEYESVSEGALWIGVAAAGAVMALFLVLFPLQQGRTVALMNSLGADRWEKIRYVFGSSACILIPGAVFGGVCGGLAWKRVTARLMESVRVAIPLEANTPVMAAVFAAVFVIVVLAASLAAALALTGEKGLKKRK